MNSDVGAIILAAGKGTRINLKDTNKVTLPFLGKPIIEYGVKLMEGISDKTVVVIGTHAENVKEALKNHKVTYAYQTKRLGTGHAAKIGLLLFASSSPGIVLIGYGDHMMFYKKNTISQLIGLHKKTQAFVSIPTTVYQEPDKLSWGRIVRDKNGFIIDIIEQKDADENIRKIKEVNPGFYCFDYSFLKDNIHKLKKSSVTGEYYLTDMVKLAVSQRKKVVGLEVPFEEVGIGVNRLEELEQSQELYKKSIDSHQ